MGGTELEALKAVRKKGGETTVSAIAAEIKMSSDYTRLVCRGLGMDDYVDLFKNGRVRLTEKGMAALRRVAPKPQVAAGASESEPADAESKEEDGESEEEEKQLSPEEKYRLWTSRAVCQHG